MPRPLHFLVTDDEVDKRILLGMTLTRAFPTASIFQCQSGREALDYFLQSHVDVLLTNHNMPELTGIELIKEIRHRGASLPIIMITGHDELILEGLAAGADLVLDTRQLLHLGAEVRSFLTARGLLE